MVQPVTAVFVMIASPSDIAEARQAVYTALARWNETNTTTRNVALIPLRWETGTVPMLGGDPQAIINKQLVDKADIVIALFGSRVGKATPETISGTVSEIETAEADGKAVHLYFSSAPHPNNVDLDQLKALQDFKAEIEKRGLYGSFNSPEELTAHVWQAIEHDLGLLALTAPQATAQSRGARLLAQPGSERTSETDNKGRMKTKTHHWVEIVNQGGEDATEVQVTNNDEGVWLRVPENTVIHAGQSRRFPVMYSFGGSEDPTITIAWNDSEGQHENTFHIG